MPRLTHSRPTRWAVGDGGLTSPTGAAISEADALDAMPALGLQLVEVGGDAFEVERVGSRYCSVDDVRERASVDNDDFGDAVKYPDDRIFDAIQAAEEAIEDACKRSFCKRARTIAVPDDPLYELPEVDVQSVVPVDGTDGLLLLGDRQVANVSGGAVTATMTYGATCSERIRRATRTLVASYLRPRAGAENAKGASVNGVYISYELATGDDGTWTGIPSVDAAIEAVRSRRVVVG